MGHILIVCDTALTLASRSMETPTTAARKSLCLSCANSFVQTRLRFARIKRCNIHL